MRFEPCTLYYRLRRKKESLIAEGIINYTKSGVAPNLLGDAPAAANTAAAGAGPPRLTSAALSQVGTTGAAGAGALSAVNQESGMLGTSAADISEYSKETVVNGFLGIRVTKGTKQVRKKDDTKMHQSFEVCVCVFFFIFLWRGETPPSQNQKKKEYA